MGDNVVSSAAVGVGATFATDECVVNAVTVQVPIGKLAFGALDTATLVSIAAGLPVQQQGTWTVTGAGGSFPVTDSGGSLTVDAPVGTPVFVRLSDGTAAITTLPVSIAAAIDTELTTADLDTGAGTDTRAVVGMVFGASGGGTLVSTTNPLPIGDNGGSLTVDGTFWQATQPVSIAAAVAVTGTFWQATQPVSGTVAATQSGTWTEANSAACLTALQLIDNLVLAEDAPHVSADPGVQVLTVRQDIASPLALSGTVGDYQPLSSDETGRLITTIEGTAAGSALGVIKDMVRTEDAQHTDGTRGCFVLTIRADTAASTSGTTGDYSGLMTDSTGRLWCNVSNTVAVASHDVTNAGTFAVQAAQSGTWNVTNVSGTVSLPTGAATLAEQQTQTTALQLIDNLVLAEDAVHATADPGVQMLAVRKATPVNLSGADGDYEPLQISAGRVWASATIDAALPAGTNNIGDVDVITLPALVAGTANIGDVDVLTIPGTAAEAAALPSVFVVVAGDDGTDTQPLQLSAGGDLKITLDSESVAVTGTFWQATQPISGTVVATQSGTWNVGTVTAVTAISNALPAGDNNIGNVDIVTIPALVAGTAAIGKLAANSGVDIGDVDVTSLPALAAGTNVIGKVNLEARTSGGLSVSRLISAATTNETEAKATAGQLYGVFATNVNAAARYLKIYDNTAAGTTIGTTTPKMTILIPGNTAGGGATLNWEHGIEFTTGITYGLTTGVADADTAAVAANEIVAHLTFK